MDRLHFQLGTLANRKPVIRLFHLLHRAHKKKDTRIKMGGICCKQEELPLDVSRHNVTGGVGLEALMKANTKKDDSVPAKADEGTKTKTTTTDSNGD
jgi:hypothetical protein